MPEHKRQLSRMCSLGILVAAMAACGDISPPAAPDYAIEEAEITTPAGTVHKQVFVPAGAFPMGSETGPYNERPVHEVDLDAFYIDKFEVTNAQYLAYVEAAGTWPPQYIHQEAFNHPDQPVAGVYWIEARRYCEWAGQALPTEAQWEKAAGGVESRAYPWGEGAPDDTRGNFNFNLASGPATVGSFPDGASPYGAHDMAGNVWEWTLDEYDGGYYTRSPALNPVNLNDAELNDGPDRTLRGGGWFSSPHSVRVSARSSIYILEKEFAAQDAYDAVFLYAGIGFRCARSAQADE